MFVFFSANQCTRWAFERLLNPVQATIALAGRSDGLLVVQCDSYFGNAFRAKDVNDMILTQLAYTCENGATEYSTVTSTYGTVVPQCTREQAFELSILSDCKNSPTKNAI